MVKSRFTSVDIAAMVNSLRPALIGAKVSNVYDIAGKLFLFKFNLRKVLDTDASTAVLLVESGIRFHLTEFNRTKTPIPSGWTMNLRKLIKNKTLERIDQVGIDRVVIFGFGSVNVILELYSKGNVIVTDSDGKVLMLLRSYEFDTESIVAKNEIYPLAAAATVQTPVMDNWENESLDEYNFFAKKLSTENRFLSKVLPFAHTQLIAKAVALAKETASTPKAFVESVIEYCLSVLESAKNSTVGKVSRKNGVLFDFSPGAADDSPGFVVTEFPTFSLAVDSFFSSIEQDSDGDRIEAQRRALEIRAKNIRMDQDRRISELEIEQDQIRFQADLLESNLELCQNAILIVNALIGQKMSWPEIEETIREKKSHVIAKHIVSLDLSRNKLLLHLGDESNVWVDLGLNAPQNVSALHDQRKSQALKLERTRVQAEQAVREAEKKMKAAILKFDDTAARNRHLAKFRRRFWWEKFHWFITSEGFLVIAGRDATQNETIYKKYMRKGDAYVHADIHGAASVLVKNKASGVSLDLSSASVSVIPPLSLAEAGQFSLCLSSAWTSKIVTSAWWVWPEQVTKTAPTGEYLTTGSFMIRGRKNFLPPTRLELGVGILFFLSEDAASGRVPERKPRTELQRDEQEDHMHWDTAVVHSKEPRAKPEKKNEPVKKLEEHVDKKPISARTERLKKKKVSKHDFDDIDRRIREEVLGHAIRRIPQSPAPVVAVDETKLFVVPDKSCFRCGETDHVAAECPSKRGQQEDDQEEEEENIDFLDRLAANIGDEEEILHAIPVVGPYSAISYYPLKIKVVPGSTKRGKAAKLCTQILATMTRNPTQQQLIKLVPVEEFSECLVPDVKLAAAGVGKLQLDNKRAKKKEGKKADKA